MNVHAVHATSAALGTLGSAVNAPAGKPTSEANDYRFWSDIASYRIDGETEIGLCTVYRQKTHRVAAVERHLHTPEILIPVDAPFILPLVSGNRVEAFRVNVGEAIIVNQGVWHAACLPAETAEATYFVIFRKGTPQRDVEKKPIEPAEISG